MKKIKLMGLTLVAGALLTGCSCSKVDENTYVNAVSAYNSSDAISFSRIEIITKEGEDSYTRKKIDAKYVFSSNKEVSKMQYSRIDTVNSNGGASSTSEIAETYYNSETNTIYNYFREGTQQVYRYKESNKAYNAKYNVNACNDLDCYRMIVGNFAPIFALDEVMNFVIKDNDGKGEATFKAVCPSFENCASSSQLIEYNLTIGENGNIEALSYEIINGDSTHTINYTFYSYGSNNVEVDIPKDLSSYKEKI